MPRKKPEERAIQKTIYIPKALDDRIKKYIVSQEKTTTYSQVINRAIQDFFKIHANQDELAITTKIIENTIRKELKPTTDRIIKFLAKSTKAGYSSIFIQAQVLAYIFNTDDEQDFLKETIKKAEAMGYSAVKNYSLDEDVRENVS